MCFSYELAIFVQETTDYLLLYMNKVLIFFAMCVFCIPEVCGKHLFSPDTNVKISTVDSIKQQKKKYKELLKKIKTAQSLASARKPNYASAWSTIKPLLSDSLINKEPSVWYVAGFIQNKLELAQAEKIFLKQAYDTVGYYRAIYDMAGYFYKADSLSQLHDSRSKRRKYRKSIEKILAPDLVNLYYGGLFYALKEKYKEAQPYFTRYIDSFQWAIFNHKKRQVKVPLSRAAYYQVLCGYVLKKQDAIVKYTPMVLVDTALTRNVLPIITDTYQAKKDTVQWLASLKRGLRDYRDDPYYYANMIEYYCNVKQFDKAMKLVDEEIALDKNPSQKNDAQHQYLRGLIYHKRHKFDEAIPYYESAIKNDSTHAMAYANLGVIYSLKTVGLESQLEILSMNDPAYNQTIDMMHALYRKALPYYEKARELRPNTPKLWAQGLYRVYYNLNMGARFKEIEPFIEHLRNK